LKTAQFHALSAGGILQKVKLWYYLLSKPSSLAPVRLPTAQLAHSWHRYHLTRLFMPSVTSMAATTC
jgi:hypothetical protein